MAEVSCPERNASDLLEQMERILDSEPLIDEVGFIHPSQFAALSGDSDISHQSLVSDVQITNGNVAPRILEAVVFPYDGTIFWCQDHKLAISINAIHSLYNAAVLAFMDVAGKYRMLINLEENAAFSVNDTMGDNSSAYTTLENDLMRHSKALLILSCDFGTAWNSRRMLISRKQNSLLLIDELQLSSLILSYSPKSECAWSHRRWVIKAIAGNNWNLPELLKKESELVEKIAEKSRMNYRAWYHRSWLVSYMTIGQVLDELDQSRKWTELHVADNCCFHYRRRLMVQLLAGFKENLDPTCNFKSGLSSIWKAELDWDELLINRYIGREALWVHRRFLSDRWINHFMAEQSALCQLSKSYNLDSFLDNELRLLNSCLSVCDNDFEDGMAHAKLAASYMLWIYKRLGRGMEKKHKELKELKSILIKVSPEKVPLWEALLNQEKLLRE